MSELQAVIIVAKVISPQLLFILLGSLFLFSVCVMSYLITITIVDSIEFERLHAKVNSSANDLFGLNSLGNNQAFMVVTSGGFQDQVS